MGKAVSARVPVYVCFKGIDQQKKEYSVIFTFMPVYHTTVEDL